MGNHNPAIAGNMKIKLNNPEAIVGSGAECLQGVFGKELPSPLWA